MVNRIIADYLKAGKRLVIPQFGAFIHKDTDGGVVFVPFLKKDDGVLATQLSTTYGLSNEEAYGVIAEYIAQVQRSVTDRGSFVVEGVGRLRIDSNGVCYLEADNRAGAGDTQPQSASMPKPVVQTPASHPPDSRHRHPLQLHKVLRCKMPQPNPCAPNRSRPKVRRRYSSALPHRALSSPRSFSNPNPNSPVRLCPVSVLYSPRAISRPVRPLTSSPFSRVGARNRDTRNLKASRRHLSNRYSPLCRIRGNNPTAELRSMPRKVSGDQCLRIR